MELASRPRAFHHFRFVPGEATEAVQRAGMEGMYERCHVREDGHVDQLIWFLT